jgi:arylsulfatase A-like enzyme
VLFRNAYCANPTCSPSRAALLTGMYPHANGMVGLSHLGARLKDYRRHLSHVLRDNGYTTALCGTQHETQTPERDLGYDIRTTVEAGATVEEQAASLLSEWGAARPGKPFFLSCGFGLTHRTAPDAEGVEWHNGEQSPAGDARYVRPPAPLPDTAATRRDYADFLLAAARLDSAMGRVLDALEKSGMAEITFVVITTDHGIAFPRMKCNLTDHGTGVMMMFRGPSGDSSGGWTGGKVIDALVSHVDVLPTLCDVAALPRPGWLQGVSLTPLLRGAESVRDAVFSEVNWHVSVEPMRTVRTGRYRYIRRYAPRSGPVLGNCDDSVSKNELRALGWDECAQPGEELYDLAFDPVEACNRAGDPCLARVLGDLRSRLDLWMQQTGDPLLGGRLDPWPGMVAFPPEATSNHNITGKAEPFAVA